MASDINKMLFTGKICGKDAEVRNQFCNFCVAISSSRQKDGKWENEKNYINCSWYGKNACSCANGMKVGTQVTVIGQFKNSNYEKNGQKVRMDKCFCEEVIISSSGYSRSNNSVASQGDLYSTSNTGIDANDIPF